MRKGRGFRRSGFLILALLFFSLGYLATVLRGEPQEGSVAGKIYGVSCHDDLIALAGANVSATHTTTGLTRTTTTDAEGSYNLTLSPGTYTLYAVFSFFETQATYSFAITSGSVVSGLNVYLTSVAQPYCPAVMFQQWVYRVDVFSNASTTDLVFDAGRRLLHFTISGMNDTAGKFLVIVPVALLDGAPVVLVDDIEVKSIIIKGALYYFVLFEHSLSTHAVTLVGSRTIPESPRGYLLIMSAAFLFLAVLLNVRNQGRTDAVNSRGREGCTMPSVKVSPSVAKMLPDDRS